VTGWPATAGEAEAVQEDLRARLVLDRPGPQTVRTVAGLDVAYEDGTDRLAAAVVVLDAAGLEPVETAVVRTTARFPYVPGLFAFRELPALVEALERIGTVPDLLVCDGHGLAHPRRFGLACHLGVLTGLPTVGVGKTPLVGSWAGPGPRRGDQAPLTDGTDEVGRVLRTQDGVRPVFVSVGSGLDLDTAARHVLALAPRHRLPETTRAADRLSRRALREG
jgi:deoxyribonuclease V